jgi:transcriptional regulator with XRE-family HTH domain
MPKLESWTHGDDLRMWREQRLRISQQAAANRLDMSIAAYGKWERGQVVPTQESLRLLVERLDVPPDLVGFQVPKGWELVPAEWIRAEFLADREVSRLRHEEVMKALSDLSVQLRARR